MRSSTHVMSRALPSQARVVLSLALSALLACAAALVTASTADAAGGTAYRFWGYYQLTDGAWQFAQTGSDATKPADGSVEGWRFATAAPNDPRFPRATPTFDEICGDTEEADGSSRVGVVIDYGRSADTADGAEPPQPRAECAVVPEGATGNDVLAAVAETRMEQGLVCGLDGFPASGCGEPVDPLPEGAQAPDEPVELTGLTTDQTAAGDDGDTESPTATSAQQDADTDGGLGTGVWVGLGAVVLAVVIGAAAMMRRRGAGPVD